MYTASPKFLFLKIVVEERAREVGRVVLYILQENSSALRHMYEGEARNFYARKIGHRTLDCRIIGHSGVFEK
jgi:hypothetical protein